MNIQKFSAALMVTGLLMAAGQGIVVTALAQSAAAEKQKTQDGADSAFGNGYDELKNKQKTREGVDSAFGNGYDELNKDKQRTQNLTHTEPTAAMTDPK